MELPKKNGKSELAAAVALLLLCADSEFGGEVYGCAVDQQQAGIVFDVALNMIDQCGPLKKRITFSSAKKQITFKPLRSVYKAVSAEYGNKDGFNAHGVIFDELHAQKSSDLYDVMTNSSGLSRQQQLVFIITTAGLDRESICWKKHRLAREIIDGERPPIPSFYPVIYGIKEEEDWRDEAVWRRVNPSYGVALIEDNFRLEYEKALIDPVAENAFRRLNLNEWVSPYSRWMPMDIYDKCGAPFDPKMLAGRECYGGLDLSFTNDMSAFVLAFPPTEANEPFYVLPFYWIPGEGLHDRIHKDHVRYDEWKAKGFLEITEGRVIDYSFIRIKIMQLSETYRIREIAFDRYGARLMAEQLENARLKVTNFGQGFIGMSGATKEMHRLVLQERIAHGGNPILRWNFDNMVVKLDEAGNIKPDKQKATAKIDGAVAAIMATEMANRPKRRSAYADRGIIAYGEDGFITL